jgi:hypothetical protein
MGATKTVDQSAMERKAAEGTTALHEAVAVPACALKRRRFCSAAVPSAAFLDDETSGGSNRSGH